MLWIESGMNLTLDLSQIAHMPSMYFAVLEEALAQV